MARNYMKKRSTNLSTAMCSAGSFVGTVAMFFSFTGILLIKETEP